MALNSTSSIYIALKKAVGKAHTANAKDLANESIGTGYGIVSSTVLGNSIPVSPDSSSLYSITNNIVEYLELTASVILGTNSQGYSLSLPGNYESLSSNLKKGNGFFTNGSEIYSSRGALQLIPPSIGGNNYEAKPYNGTTSIPVLDASNWYLDYFNGIYFAQDPASGNGTPTTIKAFLYIGSFVNELYVSNSQTASLSVLTSSYAITSSYSLNGGGGIVNTSMEQLLWMGF